MKNRKHTLSTKFLLQEETPSVAEVSLSAIYEEILSLKTEVHDIRRELTSYKGFLGGVLWAGSALAAAIGFLFSMFKGA